MTSTADVERSVVAIASERTLWRTQPTTIEVALPAEFRRSLGRRLQSVLLPLLVPCLPIAWVVYNGAAKPDSDFSFELYYRYLPAMLGLVLVLLVLGFLFLHRVINWLANVLLDCSGGTFLRIDGEGLTDPRLSKHEIAWADVEKVEPVRSQGGIQAVELTLKAGARYEFRWFRLDYRAFNTAVRSGKGAVLGVDIRYFDTDAYVIASVIEALASGTTAKSTPQSYKA